MKFQLYKSQSKGKLSWIYRPLQNFVTKKGAFDFRTKQLGFSLKNPVKIDVQESYDRSLNLILNDGKSYPKLINTRFSPTGMSTYEVRDRRGIDDTNIYHEDLLEQEINLFKQNIAITKVTYLGQAYSGSLKVGSYTFYFKLEDSDGNLSDIIAESGIIKVYKGNSTSKNGGFRDENSLKSLSLRLDNIDKSYANLRVFYTRSTSDLNQNSITKAYEIVTKFPLKSDTTNYTVTINGEQEEKEVSISELNTGYFIASTAQAQTICSNMLFLGNISQNTINELELQDISLRFVPKLKAYKTGIMNDESMDYYNFTGYMAEEYYRFGVVYILGNGQLTPVFNISGGKLTEDLLYTPKSIYEYNGDRSSYIFDEKEDYKNIDGKLINKWGVCKIDSDRYKDETGYNFGIDIKSTDPEGMKKIFKENNIKGYFFVRQKRLPIRLCQAITVDIEDLSHTPSLRENDGDKSYNIVEGFLNSERELVHSKYERLHKVKLMENPDYCGAFCPDYDVNYPMLNSLFQGDEYYVKVVKEGTGFHREGLNYRFVPDQNTYNNDPTSRGTTVKIIGLEDNTKLVSINNGTNQYLFAARAGEPEEAFRFSYVSMEGQGKTNKKENYNYIRGSFGPYIGLGKYYSPGSLINIYLKEKENNETQHILQRKEDHSAFYAISNRYTIDEINNVITCFRGDCFHSTFTHRINRNFNDPVAPTNDVIVDPNCWKKNFDAKDGQIVHENFKKINLGDVNAVKIGLWVTMDVVSNIDLNLRCIDSSHPDEQGMFGKPRIFYPYAAIDDSGLSKMPEALSYNRGHSKSLSERYYYEQSNTPAIKKEFTTRIAYSNIGVTDFYKNGFRTFLSTQFRDYPKEYGSIVKLCNVGGSILIVFEHGVGYVQINEKILASLSQNSPVYLTTGNVLPESVTMLSSVHGSQWKDSIIQTSDTVYGIDTVTRKVWRVAGGSFEIISDTKVSSFLNNHLIADVYQLDIASMNVVSHYNSNKRDVLFTLYDDSKKTYWNLCFNEILKNWVTFYSWVPLYSFNLYNAWFSFDQNQSSIIREKGGTLDIWKHSVLGPIELSDRVNIFNLPEGPESFEHWADLKKLSIESEILPCHWYGKQHPFEVEFIINANPESHKIFDTLRIISNNAEPESFHYQISGDVYQFAEDKENMFVRQERTKHFYNYNHDSSKNDIMYDQYYYRFTPKHRHIKGSTTLYERSTIFPLKYFSRIKYNNNVIDTYLAEDGGITHNYSEMAGAEIVRNPNNRELCIWNHVKAADLNTEGRIWGNMQYKEDSWYVQISPLLFKQANEPEWGNNDTRIPLVPQEHPFINEEFQKRGEYNTIDGYGASDFNNSFSNANLQEAKIKDKYLKVRIRYKGNKLVLIKAVLSLFSISYS